MRTEIKNLQELYAWSEFYNKTMQHTEREKCQQQIDEHKDKFNLY